MGWFSESKITATKPDIKEKEMVAVDMRMKNPIIFEEGDRRSQIIKFIEKPELYFIRELQKFTLKSHRVRAIMRSSMPLILLYTSIHIIYFMSDFWRSRNKKLAASTAAVAFEEKGKSHTGESGIESGEELGEESEEESATITIPQIIKYDNSILMEGILYANNETNEFQNSYEAEIMSLASYYRKKGMEEKSAYDKALTNYHKYLSFQLTRLTFENFSIGSASSINDKWIIWLVLMDMTNKYKQIKDASSKLVVAFKIHMSLALHYFIGTVVTFLALFPLAERLTRDEYRKKSEILISVLPMIHRTIGLMAAGIISASLSPATYIRSTKIPVKLNLLISKFVRIVMFRLLVSIEISKEYLFLQIMVYYIIVLSALFAQYSGSLARKICMSGVYENILYWEASNGRSLFKTVIPKYIICYWPIWVTGFLIIINPSVIVSCIAAQFLEVIGDYIEGWSEIVGWIDKKLSFPIISCTNASLKLVFTELADIIYYTDYITIPNDAFELKGESYLSRITRNLIEKTFGDNGNKNSYVKPSINYENLCTNAWKEFMGYKVSINISNTEVDQKERAFIKYIYYLIQSIRQGGLIRDMEERSIWGVIKYRGCVSIYYFFKYIHYIVPGLWIGACIFIWYKTEYYKEIDAILYRNYHILLPIGYKYLKTKKEFGVSEAILEEEVMINNKMIESIEEEIDALTSPMMDSSTIKLGTGIQGAEGLAEFQAEELPYSQTIKTAKDVGSGGAQKWIVESSISKLLIFLVRFSVTALLVVSMYLLEVIVIVLFLLYRTLTCSIDESIKDVMMVCRKLRVFISKMIGKLLVSYVDPLSLMTDSLISPLTNLFIHLYVVYYLPAYIMDLPPLIHGALLLAHIAGAAAKNKYFMYEVMKYNPGSSDDILGRIPYYAPVLTSIASVFITIMAIGGGTKFAVLMMYPEDEKKQVEIIESNIILNIAVCIYQNLISTNKSAYWKKSSLQLAPRVLATIPGFLKPKEYEYDFEGPLIMRLCPLYYLSARFQMDNIPKTKKISDAFSKSSSKKVKERERVFKLM